MKSNIFSTLTILLVAATVAQSRRWFAPEVSCWITQQKVSAPWRTAQRRCEKHDAILASPLNTQLFNFMQSLISAHNHSAAYFIGTRAKRSDDEVHYVSVEGRRLDDMPRAVFDAIDQLDLEQGDCLSMDRHGIRAVSCLDHLAYICYSNETTECGLALATTQAPPTTTSTPPPTSTIPPALATTQAPPTTSTPPPTSTIPPGYTYYAATGSYYKLHKSEVMWYVANTTCVSEGAHLTVVNDAEEAAIVVRIMRDATGHYYYTWTGLRDQRPGGVMDWRTVDGKHVSAVYNVWGDRRPYNDAEWTCAVFSTSDKGLYDVPCDYGRYFTCEISQQ